jgi:hypothetical protein
MGKKSNAHNLMALKEGEKLGHPVQRQVVQDSRRQVGSTACQVGRPLEDCGAKSVRNRP